MKKTIIALMLLVLMLALVSCSMLDGVNSLTSSIEYGKRYMKGETNFYVFNDDGTGYREYKYEASDYTQSGRVEFVWREASDGAVYLFKTQVHYNWSYGADTRMRSNQYGDKYCRLYRSCRRVCSKSY